MLKIYPVQICDQCYNLDGEGCLSPDCVFCGQCMRDVEFMLDLLQIRPKKMNEPEKNKMTKLLFENAGIVIHKVRYEDDSKEKIITFTETWVECKESRSYIYFANSSWENVTCERCLKKRNRTSEI